MALKKGLQLGPYEVLDAIGAGGMGEVYRARDTRLERTVAIKVLPAHMSDSPEVRQRFDREAKAISSLNHPNICALYDVGHQDGIDFLVMEYLEGETLAMRLEKGPLPPAEVLNFGIQIADALETAHRQGVIHRDLKPANVMLTPTGAKLMDFGLAKAVGVTGASGSLTALPTMTSPLTAEGSIVGTFQYMAPEQLEGKEADVRSDVYAFGAVLWEMATGRKAFEASSHAALIAAIIEREPPALSSVQPMVPPALDRVVATCLAKDPDQRWQTVHDVALQLRWIADAGSQAGIPAPVASRRKQRERLWVTATALLALATGILAVAYFGRPVPEVASFRMHVLAPEGAMLRSAGTGAGPVRISPDGRHLAFVAQTSLGESLLWVRSLDALEPRPLRGTKGAKRHFWSADSRSLGFFAGGKLKKIDITGGPALSLCNAADGRNGSWSRAGVIVFAPDSTHPIHRVPAAGGESTPVTELLKDPREETHRFPEFLPDGEHFLFLARSPGANTEGPSTIIYAQSLDSPERTLLLRGTSNALYASGHLLFVREDVLMAQPFDADELEFTGDAFPVAESVQFDTGFSRAVFSASENGVLAYQSGAARRDSQLKWFDRNGSEIAAVGQPGHHTIPGLSPDGKRAAVTMIDADNGNWDLWLYELERGIRTRFTFNPAIDGLPVWSPDGSRIVFGSNRGGVFDLFQKTASGAGTVELLYESELDVFATSWSPDGRYLMLNEDREGTKQDLVYLDMQGEAEPQLYLSTEFNEMRGRFSPDGRWLAFVSEESGKSEIYVAAFPEPEGKWQVSVAGGDEPHWAPDGTELFYLAPDNTLMVAEVSGEAASFGVGQVQPLFKTNSPNEYGWNFSVAPDGERFLINTLLESSNFSPIVVVSDWRPKD
jgi:Tol biopolymer transport system component